MVSAHFAVAIGFFASKKLTTLPCTEVISLFQRFWLTPGENFIPEGHYTLPSPTCQVSATAAQNPPSGGQIFPSMSDS